MQISLLCGGTSSRWLPVFSRLTLEQVSGELFLESGQLKASHSCCAAPSVHDLTCQLLQVTHFPWSLLSEVGAQLPDFDCPSSIPCCQEPRVLGVEFQTIHRAVTHRLLQGRCGLLRAPRQVKEVHLSCRHRHSLQLHGNRHPI